MVACLLLTATPAQAAIFEVNSTEDDADQNPGDGRCFTGEVKVIGDECTLRAAIQEANANGNAPTRDRINFDIPTTGVATITPGTRLDTITEPLVIDGYTQGEAKPNTATNGTTNADLKVELDGSVSRASSPRFDGLVVTAPNSVIKGLAINNGFLRGVFFDTVTPSDNGRRLEGCFIGVDTDGLTDLGNSAGVLIDDGEGNTIGGEKPEARNIISGNDNDGIFISRSANGNIVQGNIIGPDRNGGDQDGTLRQFKGIYVLGNNNIIGGSSAAGNHVAYHQGRYGVQVQGVDGQQNVAIGNSILSNSIHDNAEHGIELGADGVRTPNDPATSLDADKGPNRFQNFPVLTSATKLLDNTVNIAGKLNSSANHEFRVQLFSNPASDPEEGRTFLGEIPVKTNRKGKASFAFATERGVVSEGQFITATTTRVSTGDTSEFSEARRVEGQVIDPG